MSNRLEVEISGGKCVGLWGAAGVPGQCVSTRLSSNQVCLLVYTLMQCNTHPLLL